MRRFLPCISLALTTISLLLMSASAQTGTYKVLHNFTGGSDGAYPSTSPTFDRAGNLYGMAGEGGSGTGCATLGCGIAFELSQRNARWGLTPLTNFSSPNGNFPQPNGSVILDAKGNVYWTNSQGGAPTCYCGVVMELTKSGGVWTTKTLHAFLGGTVDGEDPLGLVQDKAGNLYGVTGSGGPNSFAGILFELSPNADGGWTYNILHSFGLPGDGVSPLGAIAIDQAGNIYGTTQGGGLYDYGTVFKLSSNDGGWTLTNIYNFTLDFGNTQQQDGVAIDGAGILYGVTRYGGEYELGTLRTYAQRRVLESDRVAHLYRRQRRRVSLWTSDHRSIRRCLWYGRLRRDQPIRHGL